jgi:WhiB family redox-sensing transcriptional regulator
VSDWYARAACKGYPTNLWFPDKGWTVQAAAAKLVCNRCPVRAECLEAGAGELGIWGGLSERKRRPQADTPRGTGHCLVCNGRTTERAVCCSDACRRKLARIRARNRRMGAA